MHQERLHMHARIGVGAQRHAVLAGCVGWGGALRPPGPRASVVHCMEWGNCSIWEVPSCFPRRKPALQCRTTASEKNKRCRREYCISLDLLSATGPRADGTPILLDSFVLCLSLITENRSSICNQCLQSMFAINVCNQCLQLCIFEEFFTP